MPRPIDAVPMPTIAGVPLYYERRTTTDRWGDMAPNEQFAPLARPHFYATLERSFKDLWRYTTEPSAVISAGAFVEKPGEHGDAEAFDLDGLIWSAPGKNWMWNATDYETPLHKRYYCGLMCHFMLTFGNVLGWEYNVAHHDHIHLDNAMPPGFRSNSHAIVTSIQATLAYVWGLPVKVDGDWGPKTVVAWKTIAAMANGIYPTFLEYQTFLMKSREAGLRPTTVVPTKLQELEQGLKDLRANLAAVERDFADFKAGLE
jgi:hypothetical protein